MGKGRRNKGEGAGKGRGREWSRRKCNTLALSLKRKEIDVPQTGR